MNINYIITQIKVDEKERGIGGSEIYLNSHIIDVNRDSIIATSQSFDGIRHQQPKRLELRIRAVWYMAIVASAELESIIAQPFKHYFKRPPTLTYHITGEGVYEDPGYEWWPVEVDFFPFLDVFKDRKREMMEILRLHESEGGSKLPGIMQFIDE